MNYWTRDAIDHMEMMQSIPLKNEKIAWFLDMHSVPNYEQNGHIYADTMEAFDDEGATAYDDLTGYTRSELYAWLGY